MARGREYRRWKTLSKYVSRLKKHMYYWLVRDGVVVTRNGHTRPNWRKPKTWRELDEKGGHSKLLRNTGSIESNLKWEKADKRNKIKKLRSKSKDIINEELNNELKK